MLWNIIVTILIGALAGWLAGLIMKTKGGFWFNAVLPRKPQCLMSNLTFTVHPNFYRWTNYCPGYICLIRTNVMDQYCKTAVRSVRFHLTVSNALVFEHLDKIIRELPQR